MSEGGEETATRIYFNKLSQKLSQSKFVDRPELWSSGTDELYTVRASITEIL